MRILSLSLGLTTYSGGKSTGHVMTDALEWTQMQHAGAIENYIIPGDHRRVKRTPCIPGLPGNVICPLNAAVGKFGLATVPGFSKIFAKFSFVPGPQKPLAKTGLKLTKGGAVPASLFSFKTG